MSKKNELVQRIIAAFFGALIIISSILIGKWTFFAVFLFIALITQWEFYRLVRSQSFIPMRVLGVSVGAVLFAMTFLIEAEFLPFKYYFVLLPFSALIYFFKLYKKNEESPFINIAFFLSWHNLLCLTIFTSQCSSICFQKWRIQLPDNNRNTNDPMVQ